MALLSREDVIDGLTELFETLQKEGITGGLQIIGGAALALRYFDRASTTDIDARLQTSGPIDMAVTTIGQRRGWGRDWVNDAGAKFIPHYGKTIEGETLVDRDGLTIQVASAEALLAMKLRANRPGRDNDDIAHLMTLCDVSSVGEAEELYESYYPGDALDPRAVRIVERVIQVGRLARIAIPAGPEFFIKTVEG